MKPSSKSPETSEARIIRLPGIRKPCDEFMHVPASAVEVCLQDLKELDDLLSKYLSG